MNQHRSLKGHSLIGMFWMEPTNRTLDEMLDLHCSCASPALPILGLSRIFKYSSVVGRKCLDSAMRASSGQTEYHKKGYPTFLRPETAQSPWSSDQLNL